MSSYDRTSDKEVSSDQDCEAETRSCSPSLDSFPRMREVSVRLTDIRKTRPDLEAMMSPSPVPVKRGRGRPRKSLTQSPRITNFFSSKTAALNNESDNCSSDTSTSEKTDRRSRRSLLADVNQIPSPRSSGSRTPVRSSRISSEAGDKENQEESAGPGGLLKFVDSSGLDITMEVKVSATPEKLTPVAKKTEDFVSDPEIDEEMDFNAAFDKVKKNVSSLMQGGVAKNVVTKVAVESSPSLSMDDVLHRLNQENTVDSEVEYVVKGDPDKDELSADDEDDMEDLPTTSTAWSSITTLMMDSPQPLLVASPAKKKSPKKYQRSQRMSRLIDHEVTGTDTDDCQDTETRIKKKPHVTVTSTGSDDSDFEVSFSNGPSKKNDCSFDDLATVIDFSNNIAPPKPTKEADVVAEQTKADKQQVESETITAVPEREVTETEDTDRLYLNSQSLQIYIHPPVFRSEFVVLDPVWAKVGSHPWWPGLVCNDPGSGDHTRIRPRAGHNPGQEHHVTFFGENTRAWVVSSQYFRL